MTHPTFLILQVTTQIPPATITTLASSADSSPLELFATTFYWDIRFTELGPPYTQYSLDSDSNSISVTPSSRLSSGQYVFFSLQDDSHHPSIITEIRPGKINSSMENIFHGTHGQFIGATKQSPVYPTNDKKIHLEEHTSFKCNHPIEISLCEYPGSNIGFGANISTKPN